MRATKLDQGSSWCLMLAVEHGRRSCQVYEDTKTLDYWTRCSVDRCCLVHKASFCIPDSQTWESLPLSALFNAKNDADNIGDDEILLVPTCCGRFGVTHINRINQFAST